MSEERAGYRRREFLKWAGAAPLALGAAGSLLACGGEAEPGNPYAGEPDPGSTPETPDETPVAAAPETPEPAPSAPDEQTNALVTEIASMQATVQALQYTNESSKPDQRCDNCQFYSATGDGRGKCQLFTQGLVTAGGWCASWTKKIES